MGRIRTSATCEECNTALPKEGTVRTAFGTLQAVDGDNSDAETINEQLVPKVRHVADVVSSSRCWQRPEGMEK